jgi:basic membrane protein A and related proteins
MKKVLGVVLAVCMVASIVGCNSKKQAASGKYELALVTDANSIDDKGFNQGAWEGLDQYAKEKNISHQYYRPIDQSTDGYLVAIETAVNNGAKLVVCPGFLFEAAIYKAQDLYPKVHFILLDGVPQNGDYTKYKTASNTYSIVFSEDQSGFLAGYAAVKEGYRNLGFFGAMAVPAVVRYGYGYVQGAEYAAKELGLKSGAIKCKYTYTGTFAILPENQTKAASWYQSGTEAIFGCGTPPNVFAAAESVGGNCVSIGVDLDQSAESKTVVTSAMKMLSVAIYDGITKFYAGSFPGGVNATLGVKENAVGLPMKTSRFKKFSQSDYDTIYKKMVNNDDGIISNMITDTKITVKGLGEKMKYVTIEEVK